MLVCNCMTSCPTISRDVAGVKKRCWLRHMGVSTSAHPHSPQCECQPPAISPATHGSSLCGLPIADRQQVQHCLLQVLPPQQGACWQPLQQRLQLLLLLLQLP